MLAVGFQRIYFTCLNQANGDSLEHWEIGSVTLFSKLDFDHHDNRIFCTSRRERNRETQSENHQSIQRGTNTIHASPVIFGFAGRLAPEPGKGYDRTVG